MSTATEIEEAILALSPEELEKLARWWETALGGAGRGTDFVEAARTRAIEATSGCLTGEDGADFAAAVAKAGEGAGDDHSHGW